MTRTYLLFLGIAAVLLFSFSPFYFLDLRGRSRRIVQRLGQLQTRKVHTYLLLENSLSPKYQLNMLANNANFVVKHRPFLAYIVDGALHVDGSDKLRPLAATCYTEDTIIEASLYSGIGSRQQLIPGIHIASTACDNRFIVLGEDVRPIEVYNTLKSRKIWKPRWNVAREDTDAYTKYRDLFINQATDAGFNIRLQRP